MQLSRALLHLLPHHNRVSWREDSPTVMWQTNSAVAERAVFVNILLIEQRIETNSELQKPQPLCQKKQQLYYPFLAFYFPDWIWKDCICFLSHQSTLWACVQLIVHLDPLVLLCIIAISNLVSCMESRCISEGFLQVSSHLSEISGYCYLFTQLRSSHKFDPAIVRTRGFHELTNC